MVKKVQFTMHDQLTSRAVTDCALVRQSLLAANAGAYGVMAAVPGTSENFVSTTAVRPTDSSIASATVDNTRYAYWLQCYLATDGTGVGRYDADVIYNISAANG